MKLHFLDRSACKEATAQNFARFQIEFTVDLFTYMRGCDVHRSIKLLKADHNSSKAFQNPTETVLDFQIASQTSLQSLFKALFTTNVNQLSVL